jgi:hypothetical protein
VRRKITSVAQRINVSKFFQTLLLPLKLKRARRTSQRVSKKTCSSCHWSRTVSSRNQSQNSCPISATELYLGTISPCTKIRRSVQLGVAYKKCAAGTNILTARVRYLLRRLTCRRIVLEHAMAASDRRNPLVCNNTLAEFAFGG